jgi:SAM-dependent methyltransferase
MAVKITPTFSTADDLAFWDNWIGSRGGEWHDDYATRTRKHDLSEEFRALITKTQMNTGKPKTARILDVAPGPLTALGTLWPGVDVELRVMDPSAEAYQRLLAKHKVVPPVTPDAGSMTGIADKYSENFFDVVNLPDSLKKSSDPLETLLQCTRSIRPGGHVVLGHATELAPWHLEHVDGTVYLIHDKVWTNVTAVFEGLADLEINVDHLWVKLKITKLHTSSAFVIEDFS